MFDFDSALRDRSEITSKRTGLLSLLYVLDVCWLDDPVAVRLIVPWWGRKRCKGYGFSMDVLKEAFFMDGYVR